MGGLLLSSPPPQRGSASISSPVPCSTLVPEAFRDFMNIWAHPFLLHTASACLGGRGLSPRPCALLAFSPGAQTPLLPLTHSLPATLDSWRFLQSIKRAPASGPLHRLFPPPERLFSQVPTRLTSVPFSGLYSNDTFLNFRPSLTDSYHQHPLFFFRVLHRIYHQPIFYIIEFSLVYCSTLTACRRSVS